MSKKKSNNKKEQEQEDVSNVDQATANESTEQETPSCEDQVAANESKEQEELKTGEGTLNASAEVQELKDKYIRLLAEFENYKKRTIKEKLDLMKTAAADTMTALLPVLDDFDRAKKNADDDNSTEQFSEGVNLVYNKLYTVLKQKGLEPMDTNGKDFDPDSHESITEIPAPTAELKGKIVDTIEKGYLLKDKIIRYAKVVIGK